LPEDREHLIPEKLVVPCVESPRGVVGRCWDTAGEALGERGGEGRPVVLGGAGGREDRMGPSLRVDGDSLTGADSI